MIVVFLDGKRIIGRIIIEVSNDLEFAWNSYSLSPLKTYAKTIMFSENNNNNR